jgi:hypothetical protein
LGTELLSVEEITGGYGKLTVLNGTSVQGGARRASRR